MRLRPVLVFGLLVGLGALAGAAPADAQDKPQRVDISFDIGPYDSALGDFPIQAVALDGDLDDGEEITVELRGRGGQLLWSAAAPFRSPSTAVEVDPPIAVGSVTDAGVVQRRATIVASLVLEPPQGLHSAGGGTGSGQLALSMVVIVALFAILFRSPLPSASTQRWTQ